VFSKTAELLGTINVQNSGQFTLASQVEIYQLTLLLVTYQMIMLFNTAVIIAGSFGRDILLNGQMTTLNLNGMAQGMLLVLDWC
jgi:hypothetical protein